MFQSKKRINTKSSETYYMKPTLNTSSIMKPYPLTHLLRNFLL